MRPAPGRSCAATPVGIVLREVTGAQVNGNTLNHNDAPDVWVAAASASAGVPYPIVTANLARHALDVGYPT